MTIVVIGERDQARSIFLNNLQEIYCKIINKFDKPIVFKAQNSLSASNGLINISTSDSMRFLDSPGLNPTNQQHLNQNLFNNFIGTIRKTIQRPEQGINMFIQCLGPNDLLKQNFIETMQDFLFSISVFNRETTIEDIRKCHPLIVICFTHISRYED